MILGYFLCDLLDFLVWLGTSKGVVDPGGFVYIVALFCYLNVITSCKRICLVVYDSFDAFNVVLAFYPLAILCISLMKEVVRHVLLNFEWGCNVFACVLKLFLSLNS